MSSKTFNEWLVEAAACLFATARLEEWYEVEMPGQAGFTGDSPLEMSVKPLTALVWVGPDSGPGIDDPAFSIDLSERLLDELSNNLDGGYAEHSTIKAKRDELARIVELYDEWDRKQTKFKAPAVTRPDADDLGEEDAPINDVQALELLKEIEFRIAHPERCASLKSRADGIDCRMRELQQYADALQTRAAAAPLNVNAADVKQAEAVEEGHRVFLQRLHAGTPWRELAAEYGDSEPSAWQRRLDAAYAVAMADADVRLQRITDAA